MIIIGISDEHIDKGIRLSEVLQEVGQRPYGDFHLVPIRCKESHVTTPCSHSQNKDTCEEPVIEIGMEV